MYNLQEISGIKAFYEEKDTEYQTLYKQCYQSESEFKNTEIELKDIKKNIVK